MRAYFKTFGVAQRIFVALRNAGRTCTMMPMHPTGGKATGWRVSWN